MRKQWTITPRVDAGLPDFSMTVHEPDERSARVRAARGFNSLGAGTEEGPVRTIDADDLNAKEVPNGQVN